ncbi:hypothetical protein [Defluviimonas sp. SAOS-178_SWC]|uniref:DUF7742 family protein n=1 Tax=Defluviimonas sp. SAOS-178_SWC TaxID=3121287 RepID=UPI0032221701
MRTITHGDVTTVARAVRGLPPDEQRRVILKLLDRAHAADLFRKKFGRAHPFWGNGSLMAAVLVDTRAWAEPFLSDISYLEALSLVIDTVLDWRRRAQ